MQKRGLSTRKLLRHALTCLVLALFLTATVLAAPAAAFRFVFLADSRAYRGKLFNQEALKDLLREVKKHHPDFVVFGGDMARWGGTKRLGDWASFMHQELGGLKLYPVKGNHEIHAGDSHKSIRDLDRDYKQVFGLKRANYSFIHGQQNQTLFVILDTAEHQRAQNRGHPHISQGQLDWLQGKLDQARERQIIVIAHAPLRPMGHKTDASMNKLEALLQQHPRVVLYLCGHDHDYQVRQLSPRLTQVICGNAGAEPKNPWCFTVVDVESTGVHFTGYRGKHGQYHADPHKIQLPPQPQQQQPPRRY